MSFGSHKPAGTVVVVKDLHFGCKIGIEAITGMI